MVGPGHWPFTVNILFVVHSLVKFVSLSCNRKMDNDFKKRHINTLIQPNLHINPFVIWTLLVGNEPQVLYTERSCPTYICNENNLILIKCHSGYLQESCSGGHCKPSKTAGYPETNTLGNQGSNLSSLIPCLELTLITQTENIFFLKVTFLCVNFSWRSRSVFKDSTFARHPTHML